jgi:hypothetical protein
VNAPFGSGFVAGDTGVLLNNHMNDFSLAPSVPNIYRLVGNEANAVEAGKRPLSSMSPTFVEDERGVLVFGTPGGSRIISMVLEGILAFVDQPDFDLQRMVGAPRYHHQYLPDRIEIEPGAFSQQWTGALRTKGHTVEEGGASGVTCKRCISTREPGALPAPTTRAARLAYCFDGGQAGHGGGRMQTRRHFLKVSAGGLLLAGGIRGANSATAADSLGPAALPSGALQSALLAALPGKLPLIRKSIRPPNFETPLRFFNEAFTPNDAFFVRYHLADIPQVSQQRWKLAVTGDALDKPFEITYEELVRGFEQVEVAAVCMCRATGAGCRSRMFPACNGAMAQSAMPDGAA